MQSSHQFSDILVNIYFNKSLNYKCHYYCMPSGFNMPSGFPVAWGLQRIKYNLFQDFCMSGMGYQREHPTSQTSHVPTTLSSMSCMTPASFHFSCSPGKSLTLFFQCASLCQLIWLMVMCITIGCSSVSLRALWPSPLPVRMYSPKPCLWTK